MAIAPGSYSFMGGTVLGKGSEGQFVLVRSSDLLTAFTDDEYNACIEAVYDGKAVCVQYTIGTATFQIQLLNVTGLGNLQFAESSPDSVVQYRVSGTSPHTVSIVKSGGAQQFVLERDDMSTAFTASEYLQCQTRISEGTAVCVQWKSGTAMMQAQLATILGDGSLLFSFTTVDLETIYIVAGSTPHNITAHTNNLGGGDQFVLLRTDITTQFTNTEYQDCVDAVTAGKAVCVQYGSNQIQLGAISGGALVFTQSSPDMLTKYTVSPTTGAHTISAERIAVGVPIYASLQSAIADEAKLPVGTYFETNGFHTSGDGGAARYVVSSSGTANGKNIITLSAGKLAVLQVDTERGIYPEQIGYEKNLSFADKVDCTPYFNLIWTLCNTVRLHNGRYWFYDYVTLPKGAKIIGENIYTDTPSEMSTYRSGDYFVYCENRENVIENVVLSNRHNNGNLSPVSTGGVGIRSNEWLHDGAAHFDYAFRHLRLMGFRKGVELQGTTKWAVTLYDIRCSQCYIGIEFGEASFNIDLHKIYTDHCTYAGINFHGEGVFGFYDCNLGSINTAVKVSEYGGSQYTDILLTFVNTNFECDDQTLTNIPGLYFDIDDALDVILNMYGCRFMQNAGVYTVSNRCMKLGAKTLVNMKGCEVRNNTGVAQSDDNFWNENYPCKFTLGAIRISDNCRGVPTPQFTDSKFDLCCVETDLTEMEIISQGGGGTPINNLWDNSSPTILAGYVSESNGDHPNGFFTLNNSTQMTLAIPITNYMQGQTIRISAGTTSHNRWKYGKIGAIPTATVTDMTYVGNSSTDASGRTYSDIPVGATETGYILIFFGSSISSTDMIADAMACVSPYYTPYEPYQGGSTTYYRQLRTSLINLDELVTALNLRGNSLN